MKLSSLLLAAAAATVTGASAADSAVQQPMGGSHAHFASPPALGFGTWNLRSEGHNASKAVAHAIRTGYRHIDCAAIYGNERDVGRGIRKGLHAAGLGRGDIWVTSKLWNNRHGAVLPAQALARTLEDLGVGYLDLYLMHWPVGEKNGKSVIEFVETWKAMEKLLAAGLVRHIGVSNFDPEQLRVLMDYATIKPFAHQMEMHPYLPQSAWLQYHHEEGIHVTAYSPLGNANPTYGRKSRPGSVAAAEAEAEAEATTSAIPLIGHPIMTDVARRRGCTPATVSLAWGISRGVSVIPKSQHKDRIEENFGTCELEYEDIVRIQAIGRRNLTRFNNPSKGWDVTLYQGLEDA